MFSEKNYKILSQNVYWIDEKHKNHNTSFSEGKTFKKGSFEYKILKTEDNSTNGMQAMAVAPIINGKADTSEVVIAYAGTNPKDPLDIMTDIQTIGLGSKILVPEGQQLDLENHQELDEQGIPKSIEYVDGQVMSAEKFVEDVQIDYPHASITTTGHSLGEYIALYIAAEYKLKNVGFNGPDPSNILSEEAKQWAKDHPGMLTNYTNTNDLVEIVNSDGTGASILVDMGQAGGAHSLDTWKFDKDGNVHINDIYVNREARQLQAERRIQVKMHELSMLQTKLMASGGLSTNEEIFLDNTQALLTVEFLSESMRIDLEHVIKIYQEGITQAEEIWENGIQLARSIGTTLTYSDILHALETGGATKYSIVFEPTAYYRDKITNALKIEEKFNQLASEIKASIEELKKSDRQLANQIRQGA